MGLKIDKRLGNIPGDGYLKKRVHQEQKEDNVSTFEKRIVKRSAQRISFGRNKKTPERTSYRNDGTQEK